MQRPVVAGNGEKKKRTGAAVAVALVCIACLFEAVGFGLLHRGAKPDAEAPAAQAPAQGGVSSTSKAASPGRTYGFKRLIHARMGTKDLVELKLAGAFYLEVDPSADSAAGHALRALVRIDSAEAVGQPDAGHDQTFPLTELSFTERGSPPSIIKVQTQSDAEHREAAARFAMDIIDQYRFFSTTDLQGHYEAKIEDLSGGRYRKTKLRYLDAPYSTGRVASSRHELKVGGDGWPERVAGDESVQLGADGPGQAGGASEQAAQFAVRTETSYLIEATAPDPRLAFASSDDAWTTLAITTDGARKPRIGRRMASRAAGDLSKIPELGDLLATLRSGALKSGSARLSWFRDTVERLDAQSGRLDSVRQALADSRADTSQFQLLVGALAGSIEADASAMLLETYSNDRFSREDHALIMNGWIASDTPFSTQTTAFLSNLATSSDSQPAAAGNAMLALGSQLARLQGDDGAGASAQAGIESLLLGKLAAAGSEADTVAALDAMGNAGLADFLVAIAPFLANPSAHVRAHAYLALRLIPGAAAGSYLAAGQVDPSNEVKDSIQIAENIRQSGVQATDN